MQAGIAKNFAFKSVRKCTKIYAQEKDLNFFSSNVHQGKSENHIKRLLCLMCHIIGVTSLFYTEKPTSSQRHKT